MDKFLISKFTGSGMIPTRFHEEAGNGLLIGFTFSSMREDVRETVGLHRGEPMLIGNPDF